MGVAKDVVLQAVHQVPFQGILYATRMEGARDALNPIVKNCLEWEASAVDMGVIKNVHGKVRAP